MKSELEDMVYGLFKDNQKQIYFNSKYYKIDVVRPRKYNFQNKISAFDLELQINNKSFGIIDLKTNTNRKLEKKKLTPEFKRALISRFQQPHRYIIKTSDGVEFLLVDKYSEDNGKYLKSFDELIKTLIETFEKVKNSNKLSKIKKSIQNQISTIEEKNVSNSQLIALAREYVEQIEYSILDNSYRFIPYNDSLKDSKENQFIKRLLKREKLPNEFYRYTSFNSVFSTIDKKSHLVNGLMAMNDSSEVNYAEKFLFGETDLDITTNLNKVHRINSKFIICCTSDKDDLTFWRLYGNDSKGVCITYKFDESNLQLEVNMFVAKVSYAKDELNHPELELLAAFLKASEENHELFELRNFNIWKHFFKPHQYKVEKEIRFLYANDFQPRAISWKISEYGVLNPYVTFPLNNGELPIKITKIMLGPKTPEKIGNHLQLRALVSSVNYGVDTEINDIEIENSSISNYRTI